MNVEGVEGATVFVVDDDPADLSIIVKYLEAFALTAVPIVSGEEVLELVQRRRPDVILLDTVMPLGMDGFEVCRRLKGDKATRDIPVIFLSVRSETVDKAKGLNLGAVDYVTKPVDPDELLSRVRAHMTISRLHKELLEANRTLKEKVVARTEALARANEALKLGIEERKQAEEALRRYATQLEALRQVGLKLAAELDPDSLLNLIVSRAIELVGGIAGGLHLYRPEREVLELVVTNGPNTAPIGSAIHRGEGLSGRVWKTGEPLIVNTYQQWEGRVAVYEGWTAIVGVPIRWGEDFLGVLDILTDAPHMFSLADSELLGLFAVQAAIAIKNSRLFEQVRAGRERLQALSHQLVEIQEAERRHVARELHDEIGQNLTGLNLLLGMSAGAPIDTIRARMDEARALVEELMEKVDELALDLRPAMLDDLGLLPALLWHFERYTSQTGVRVHLEHTGLKRRYPSGFETGVYRIVQEALTNVARHAGVSEVAVRLWVDQDTLTVQVEDQGSGFDTQAALAAGDTSGLSGMNERVGLLGGQLTVESAPGTGTRVTAGLPPGGSHRKEAS